MTPAGFQLPRGQGNPAATYLVVGDHYSFADDMKKSPFCDGAGTILHRMLQEAGIQVSQCYFTNLVNAVPPQGDFDSWMPMKKNQLTQRHVNVLGRSVDPIIVQGMSALNAEITLLKPRCIITLGNPPLWALTGNWSALSWRGSELKKMGSTIPLVPTLHPRFISAQWQWRVSCLNDLRRAKKLADSGGSTPVQRHFTLRPSLETTLRIIDGLLKRLDAGEQLWLDLDLETNAGHIVCLGFSWSRSEAICIPFASSGLHKHYFSAEEEGMVVFALYKLFTHPKVAVRWQNGLFDAQYIFRHWHYIPRGKQDTMISHHSMWSGMQKSLAFQASMYCESYSYWKDMRTTAENKEGA